MAIVFLAFAGVLGVFGLRLYIDREVASTGDQARQRFDGDRIEALMKLVDCDGCALTARNRGIWALGEMGDRRALPVLRRHHTRLECNHAVSLCQYELGKAIKKIEGTWDLHASVSYDGTDPTSQ